MAVDQDPLEAFMGRMIGHMTGAAICYGIWLGDELGLYRFLAAVRTNALQIWPKSAYEQDVVVGSTLRRTRLLINAPDAIHHVLVENTANYRRTSATIRSTASRSLTSAWTTSARRPSDSISRAVASAAFRSRR